MKANQHNILSFDVEEWFMSYDASQIAVERWPELPGRIEENIHDILAFLAQSNQKATFYIMGWVAQHYPDVVKEIAVQGHEIGYHSYFHELPLKQGPKAFEADLEKGLSLLAAITGSPVNLYRAPRFSMDCATAWAIPILLKHGIRLSSSVMSGRKCASQTLPHWPFLFEYKGHFMPEMPLNRAQTLGHYWVYTGSGYFRVMPYSMIQSLYDRHPYNMAYFHPRDFDPQVPKTKLLPFYRNIMSNLGNTSTIPKLKKLMSTNTFLPVEAAYKQFKTNHDLPVIKLG